MLIVDLNIRDRKIDRLRECERGGGGLVVLSVRGWSGRDYIRSAGNEL
jgi:hypothetical protein